MSASKRKTWQQKLHDGRKPHVEITTKDFAGIKAGQRMLIPTPALVDAYIRQIPEGTSTDTATLRRDLAMANGAEVTCPLTTGIFLRIVAEAAYEELTQGQALHNLTPFWRVLDEKSPAAKKLSFGTGFLMEQRRREGVA